MSSSIYPYDRVPFRSSSVANADCRRIELIARLFGLTAAPCAHARILELGCGSAANLIPLALEYPGARFVGCDLSESALATAQRLIDGLGLTNVELRLADICEVDGGWGSFDYILCHDVFSWVRPGVRQKILTIARRNLAARGVGYISYDVLPGWQLRGIVRDMMRYHAAGFTDPREAVDQARAMLAMGAAVQDQQPGPYAELLRDEYYVFSTIGDEQLYHLAFTEHHQPFYFHEFGRLIEQADLQVLGDADVTRLVGPREPTAVREFLDELPWLKQQQYLDFLTNGTSRGALVCHRDVEIGSHPDDSVLCDAWISLATGCRKPVAAASPIEHALSCLEKRRPEFVPLSNLADHNGASSMRPFMEACAARTIDVTLSPPRLSSRISDYPTVSKLVRLQARDGSTVTNHKGEAVRLTDLARHVVTLLDGVHSLDAVAQSVGEQMQTDRILRLLRDHALLVA
jgi:trans-aconitate methyltransferase